MADTLDSIIADLQNYVVAPTALFGLAGFMFDAEGESTADLSAEITDHYTEDNRALQDHIAIRPKRVTLKGYVGEVVYNNSGGGIIANIQSVVQKLTQISAYLPAISAGATQIQNAISSSGGTISGFASNLSLSDTANIYGAIQNLLPISGPDTPKQQAAYAYFKALMTQGILMSIQTPWEFMTSMAIESVIAIQTENTNYITDFSIKLKEIRIAKTSTGAYSTNLAGQPSSTNSLSALANQSSLQQYRLENGLPTPPIDLELQGAAAVQAAPPIQQGNVPGISLPTQALPSFQSLVVKASDLLPTTAIPGVKNMFIQPPPPGQ